MSSHKDTGYLALLSAALLKQRDRLTVLMHRLTGLGVPGAMKPSVFDKFIRMMDQVAAAKDRETDLLSKIEAVEARHRFQRQCKTLKHPEPESKHLENLLPEPEPSERPKHGWLWFAAIWYLFAHSGNDQKKQRLTAD